MQTPEGERVQPADVLKVPFEDLRACGLSGMKVRPFSILQATVHCRNLVQIQDVYRLEEFVISRCFAH